MFSRVREGALGLPMETWIQVARSLTLSEKHALMLSCRSIHDMIAPIVYRVLVTQERLKARLGGKTNTAFSSCVRRVPTTLVLSCLMLSTHNKSGQAAHRRYVDHIKSLTVMSYVPLSNLRALPILVQLLQHTTSLRFLRVEVCDDSIPLLLALLLRYNLVRLSTLPHTVGSTMTSSPHTVLHLPALKGFRTNHCEIATCMVHLRPVEVLVIDGAVLPTGFPRLLQSVTSAASYLTTLSVTLAGPVDFLQSAVEAMMVSLPVLEYLSVRLDPVVLFEVMTVSNGR